MLAYIIDGFNLVHKIPSVKKSITPHIDLIRYIKAKKLTGSANNKVTIVFDGKVNFEAAGEAVFKVFFSQGKTADDVIKGILEKTKNKSETVVVSDDREIRDFTKRLRAKSCRVAEFIKTAPKAKKEEDKEISYSLQNEITEEMRKIWLKTAD